MKPSLAKSLNKWTNPMLNYVKENKLTHIKDDIYPNIEKNKSDTISKFYYNHIQTNNVSLNLNEMKRSLTRQNKNTNNNQRMEIHQNSEQPLKIKETGKNDKKYKHQRTYLNIKFSYNIQDISANDTVHKLQYYYEKE